MFFASYPLTGAHIVRLVRGVTMPTLDRRITVRRTVYGSRTHLARRRSRRSQTSLIWAGVADLSAFDVEQEGGTFDERLRRWDIRWRADFAAFTISELTVLDTRGSVQRPESGTSTLTAASGGGSCRSKGVAVT